MPPTRTNNTQGRQKSCSECVKAKRRCDIGQPCCARCIRQSLKCTYPPQPRSQERVIIIHEDSESIDTSQVADVGTTPFPFDLESLNDQPYPDTQFLDFDMSTAISSFDSLMSVINSSISKEDQVILARPHYSNSTSHLFSANISPAAKTRIGYAIEQLKLAPRAMVEENATIWCHPTLYEEYMPKLLQDAHATCALHLATNEINAGFVARHIEGRIQELMATPLPTALIETLARAHALMLYQIMLVFGGNIQLYGQAEALLPHLEAIGSMLLVLLAEQADPSGPLPLYPSTVVRAAWTSYIIRESLRRTVLSLFQFITLCGLLCGRSSSCAPELVRGNRVTLSAHLWNAKSAFEFGVAWNERNHFLVKELDFTEVLMDARPDDIDTFAKTILVGLQGLDDMKGWFHMRGEIF